MPYNDLPERRLPTSPEKLFLKGNPLAGLVDPGKKYLREREFLALLLLGHGAVLLVEGINEGQDFGNDPVNRGRDFLIEIQLGEDLD